MDQIQNQNRRYFLYLGLAYLLFIWYGSIVPLHYKEVPFWLAFDLFISKEPHRISPADWAANVILGVPLAYFWAGYLWRRQTFLFSIFIFTLIFVVCYCVSWVVEFSQMFFSSRTPSKNDISAQNIGVFIGLCGWWLTGEHVLNWIQRWQSVRDVPSLSDQLIKAYLVVLLFYNVMPLDLTISPVELYHKWREGRVIFIPFAFLYQSDPMQLFYELATDVVIWMPIAILLVTSGKRTLSKAWLITVLCCIGLEFLQLFVYSRISDVTDIITGIVGAALGVAAGWFISEAKGKNPKGMDNAYDFKPLLWSGAGFILWTLILFAVFWYPYEFVTDKKLIVWKIKHVNLIPFKFYYTGTEFRALTEVFHKITFFIPLGIFLSISVISSKNRGWQGIVFWICTLLICVVALTVELSQSLIVKKIPDITDFVLATLGGILALRLSVKFYQRTVKSV